MLKNSKVVYKGYI